MRGYAVAGGCNLRGFNSSSLSNSIQQFLMADVSGIRLLCHKCECSARFENALLNLRQSLCRVHRNLLPGLILKVRSSSRAARNLAV